MNGNEIERLRVMLHSAEPIGWDEATYVWTQQAKVEAREEQQPEAYDNDLIEYCFLRR